MSPQGPPPPPPPPRDQRGPGRGLRGESGGFPRWGLWVLLGLLAATFVLPLLFSSPDSDGIAYSEFMSQARDGKVEEIVVDNTNGNISGTLSDGTEFETTGPVEGGLPETDLQTLREQGVEIEYETPTPGLLETLLPFLLPVLLIIGFFVFMQRRAQSQMGGVMSIGRSKAKTYSTERPGTTFKDVAGYNGVKQEIREVVDFLKTPERVPRDRCPHPQGRAPRRSSRDGQDAHRTGGGR